MSFQWRVSLFIVVALLIALLAQLALSVLLFERSLRRDLRHDLTHFAALIEQGLTETQDGVALTPESRWALEHYDGYAEGRARLFDERGREVFALGGPFPTEPRGWLILRRRVLDEYQMEVAVSLRSHDRELRDYLGLSLLSLPMLTLVLGSGGLWLSRRVLKPLRRLEAAVEAVTATPDLSARVEVGDAKDELAVLAQRYNEMMARLELYFERERAFTRYASHELRTPITAMRAQVEAALAGGLAAERILPTLKRELERLSAVLDGLLILARDQDPPETPVDVAALARESVDRARRLAAGRPLMIDVRGPATLFVTGDRALLGRLLENVLENAVRHTGAGRIEVALVDGDPVTIEVRDEGPGVPEDAIPKLGTPFFRRERQGSSGSGLGLSVVRHIAAAHGGQVAFRNLAPRGFAVTLTLPKRRPALGGALTRFSASLSQGDARSGARRNRRPRRRDEREHRLKRRRG